MTNIRPILRRISYLFSRFGTDRCSENAAALTYMSLFALVPLLTVIYTMASAVPAFQGLEESIQAFMFEKLMPDTNTEIQDYLTDFSRQAKNLTGFGIAFLVVTAVLMLRNVEKAFNQIWRTRGNRSAVSSFLLYWAVLGLAPLTIGLALAISAYLSSFAARFGDLDLLGVGAMLLKMAPLLLSTVGFSFLYLAVPNCRVPYKHAVIGGFAAAAAFNIARSLFTTMVAGSSYTLIYGAFAAVPLFLLWIYLSWNIVLMGGVLVHSMSAYQSLEQASRPRLLKGLDTLHLLWMRQKTGEPVKEVQMLGMKGLDSETWSQLRDTFVKHKLVSQNDRGHYLLSRDLHTVTLWQLKEWINDERSVEKDDISSYLKWQQDAYQLLRGQRSQQRSQLDISLADLFSE